MFCQISKSSIVDASAHARPSVCRVALDSARSSRGSACLELAITLPALVMIFMAVVDLGRAATDYLTVNRIIYEATRYAASCGSLEEGSYSGFVGVPKGHQAVRDRLLRLLERYGIDSKGITNITTELEQTPEKYLEVRVSLSLPFHSLFFDFAFLQNLGGQATGPYLFRNAKMAAPV